MTIFFDARNWMKTEDGRTALEKEVKLITTKLIPNITEDILKAKFVSLK
jgi:hypothetical protein